MDEIDQMAGFDFEEYVGQIYRKLGYSVQNTSLSGDQGADLVLFKDGEKVAVQTKRYAKKVSNKAIQEVVASKAMYNCTKAMVVTNNYFTKSAIELADANDVELVDRDDLRHLLNIVAESTVDSSEQTIYSKNYSDNYKIIASAIVAFIVVAFIVMSISLLVSNPVSAEELNEEGYTLYEKGEYTEALNSFDKAIEIDSSYSSAWTNRGLTLTKLGRYLEAIDSLDEAIEINPFNPVPWNHRGCALYEFGLYEEALYSFDKAIEIDPTYESAQYNRKEVIEAMENTANLDDKRTTFTSIEDIPKVYMNSIGMEFVLIPAGDFEMGSIEMSSTKPIHKVIIGNSFYLGTYEVTQEQWFEVMGNNPSYFFSINMTSRNPKYTVRDNYPVEQISWDDAQEFVKMLNEMEGTDKYSLPTEAEWEYACRAGTTTKFYFGDDDSKLGEYAWHFGNADRITHLVGQKKPNSWGLYDMHGNVWEWCQDEWHSNYENAPSDGGAWQSNSISYRVLRGGSFYQSNNGCSSAFRANTNSDVRSDIGFRIVKEV
jgi:formylglycine-generating enzyme required for sulfatase activity